MLFPFGYSMASRCPKTEIGMLLFFLLPAEDLDFDAVAGRFLRVLVLFFFCLLIFMLMISSMFKVVVLLLLLLLLLLWKVEERERGRCF